MPPGRMERLAQSDVGNISPVPPEQAGEEEDYDGDHQNGDE